MTDRESVTVSLRAGEKQQFEDWAWKQKLPLSTAIRKLVLEQIEKEAQHDDDN